MRFVGQRLLAVLVEEWMLDGTLGGDPFRWFQSEHLGEQINQLRVVPIVLAYVFQILISICFEVREN